MRKRILIITAIIIVFGGALFFFSTKQPKGEAGDTLVQKTLNLFPFGKNETTVPADNQDTSIVTTDGDVQTIVDPTEIPRLRKLSTRAVAGATGVIKKRIVEEVAVPISLETETTETTKTVEETLEPTYEDISYVRFIEKATGNLYDIAVDEETPTRITNTTIPKIYEALFTDDATRVIVRYLDNNNTTIKTWSGSILQGKTGEPDRLAGLFLDDNITAITVSPDTKNIFYLKDIGDTTYGYTAFTDGTNKKQIFDSSFSEWLTQWSRTNSIALTAKASGYADGYSYDLSSTGTVFEKKLGPVFGLTRNSNSQGTYSLFSLTMANGLKLKLLDEKTGVESSLPVTTFTEKCVWSKIKTEFYCAVPRRINTHVYPDDWYQGTYFTDDILWKVDAITGVGFFVADLAKETGTSIDVISPQLTADENMLYFINKKDSLLWGITL